MKLLPFPPSFSHTRVTKFYLEWLALAAAEEPEDFSSCHGRAAEVGRPFRGKLTGPGIR